jgi:hypothetical protein
MEWGTPLPWNFERKEVLFYRETLFIGVSGDMEKKALETGISVHRGPFGNPEGTRLPGTLRDGPKRLWKRSVSLYGSSVRGTWRERSNTSTLQATCK